MEGDIDVDKEANRKDCPEEQGIAVYSGERLYPGGIPQPSLFKDREFRVQGRHMLEDGLRLPQIFRGSGF